MNKKQVKVSIVIPVSNDVLIKKCIESIDRKNMEIVIVLNGASNEFQQFVNNLRSKDGRIVTYKIQENNIGKAREVGCQKAKGKILIMMDSDCEFEKKCISRLEKGLVNADVAKGDITYRSNSLETKLVAKARETHSSSDQNAYTPLLAFRKSIVNKIGRYYFSPKIPWTEDHELAQRIVRNGLKVNPVKNAIGYHKPTTIKNDLRSAINYGVGYNFGIRSGLTQPGFLYGGASSLTKSLLLDLKRAIKTPRYINMLSKKYDFIVALYMTIWMITFSLGYYFGYLKKL